MKADLTQEYRRCFYHRRGRIAITKRARASIRQMAFTTVLTFFLFWIPFLAMILWLCSKTRTSTRINRLQFVDASHLKVAVKSTMNSSISCPALLQDLKVDDSGPMAGVWKCHCSCSGSKIKDMHISGISRKAELVTRSLDHLENISRTFSTL
ncbi:hypothetical protein CDAR_249311 [Caerostris darwini]|uniref:Uncharacterized protein n=1 Tax=Caerostris darwini TaxID=1538125 RepID=A0AAV4TGR6_9ARAC|nr:hypothetical protein CDAR_249311 [Caerostris darwini]